MLQTKLILWGSFLESPKNVWVLEGYFEKYHVAVLQALILLDQLRKQLCCFNGYGLFFVVFLNRPIVFLANHMGRCSSGLLTLLESSFWNVCFLTSFKWGKSGLIVKFDDLKWNGVILRMGQDLWHPKLIDLKVLTSRETGPGWLTLSAA